MSATLMHCEVRLEMLLNVQLILLEHKFDLFGTCIGLKNFVKVTSHTMLLVVEAIEVTALDSEDMLRHELAQHAFVKSDYLLVTCQYAWVFYAVGEQVVYLFEGEVLAVVVGFGHIIF